MRPIVKIPLKYGVIASALGSSLLIVLYFLGRHPFLIPVYMDSRIFLFGVFLYYSLRELRDFFQHGILYFWQGMIASFLFVAVFAVITSAVIGIFCLIDAG